MAHLLFTKLDVGTVYAQPDHRFCRRWAVMTDPEETLGASGAGIKVVRVADFDTFHYDEG